MINLCVGLSIFSDVQRQCFFSGPFLLFMFCVFHAVLSVHCSLVATCWERVDLLSLVCDVFLWYSPMCCPGSALVLDCIDS